MPTLIPLYECSISSKCWNIQVELQHVQSMLTGIIVHQGKFDHITPVAPAADQEVRNFQIGNCHIQYQI